MSLGGSGVSGDEVFSVRGLWNASLCVWVLTKGVVGEAASYVFHWYFLWFCYYHFSQYGLSCNCSLVVSLLCHFRMYIFIRLSFFLLLR